MIEELEQSTKEGVSLASPRQNKIDARQEIATLTAEFLKNGNKVTELPPSGIQKDYVGKVSYGNDYSGSINGAW